MSSAVSLGVLPTLTPAASRASCLACAVPEDPETIAPAWPMVLPSGAVKPATYPTTGLVTFASMYSAARSSASPPISPIMTIASVSGSASNASSASMWVVPMTGSPPIPIAVEKPRSRSSYIIWYVSVPDFDTRPTRPAWEMFAGMMPASASPGVMTPGQLGPMILVLPPSSCACAQTAAESWTGMPSVMMTSMPMPASIASNAASFENAGGTNATDTSAPVFSIASATEPNTGSSTSAPFASLCETVVPALRAFTPPTTFDPAASMRAVCLVPSPPVMPWTMIFDSFVRKIAIVLFSPFEGSAGSRELGGLVGSAVHGVDLGHERVVRLLEDAAPLFDVVPVEADDQRLRRGIAQDLEGLHDAVGHSVARRDAAEHVDEDALDLLVPEDHVEAVGHDLRRGAAADVEEVRGLHPAVVLTGVGDDVERRHDEPCAVADDADLAVELHVVEVELLRLELERVLRVDVTQLRVALMAELRVLVERDLAVERDDVTGRGLHERVHLDQRGILTLEDVPQLLEDGHQLVGRGRVEAGRLRDLARLRVIDAGERVHRDLRQVVRTLFGELLDVH